MIEAGCNAEFENDCIVTSRLITEIGARYRVFGDRLPPRAKPVTPSLEDAYIYLITQQEWVSGV